MLKAFVRLVLAERKGVLDETAGCTVKRYTSVKRQTGEDEWRHERIRLEPLNPAYEAFDLTPDQIKYVAAEWMQTLE